MKGILEFELPLEENEFRTAVDAPKVRAAIWEFSNWLRGLRKYGDEEKIDIEEVEKQLHAVFKDRGIEVWD